MHPKIKAIELVEKLGIYEAIAEVNELILISTNFKKYWKKVRQEIENLK